MDLYKCHSHAGLELSLSAETLHCMLMLIQLSVSRPGGQYNNVLYDRSNISRCVYSVRYTLSITLALNVTGSQALGRRPVCESWTYFYGSLNFCLLHLVFNYYYYFKTFTKTFTKNIPKTIFMKRIIQNN